MNIKNNNKQLINKYKISIINNIVDNLINKNSINIVNSIIKSIVDNIIIITNKYETSIV